MTRWMCWLSVVSLLVGVTTATAQDLLPSLPSIPEATIMVPPEIVSPEFHIDDNEGSQEETSPTAPYLFLEDPVCEGCFGQQPERPRWTSARPDGHSPAGVMGDHTHSQGEFMVGYMFMHMQMSENRDGQTRIAPDQIFAKGFKATPIDMIMQMHMFNVMYAPTDNVTLMLMVPFLDKWMDHVTAKGGNFRTRASGLGDLQFFALWKVFDDHRQRIHLNLGMGFPTGRINQTDVTPTNPNAILPYPMQLGSGTFDLMPGLTYLGETDCWSWGIQTIGTIRLHHNYRDYRKGHEWFGTGWVARRWTKWMSTSFRLDGRIWGNYAGADPDLDPDFIPTANPSLRAGERLDALIGMNLYVPEGRFKNLRAGVEAGVPLYQRLDGPQLETDWVLSAVFQYSW